VPILALVDLSHDSFALLHWLIHLNFWYAEGSNYNQASVVTQLTCMRSFDTFEIILHKGSNGSHYYGATADERYLNDRTQPGLRHKFNIQTTQHAWDCWWQSGKGLKNIQCYYLCLLCSCIKDHHQKILEPQFAAISPDRWQGGAAHKIYIICKKGSVFGQKMALLKSIEGFTKPAALVQTPDHNISPQQIIGLNYSLGLDTIQSPTCPNHTLAITPGDLVM